MLFLVGTFTSCSQATLNPQMAYPMLFKHSPQCLLCAMLALGGLQQRALPPPPSYYGPCTTINNIASKQKHAAKRSVQNQQHCLLVCALQLQSKCASVQNNSSKLATCRKACLLQRHQGDRPTHVGTTQHTMYNSQAPMPPHQHTTPYPTLPVMGFLGAVTCCLAMSALTNSLKAG